MRKFSVSDIEKEYSFELDRVISEIREARAKNVLLQFPDGLKQYSTTIIDYLKENTFEGTEFFIWFGSCFGACDIPVLGSEMEKDFDLVVQFGHNELMPGY